MYYCCVLIQISFKFDSETEQSTNKANKKCAGDLDRHFSQGDIPMANRQ